MRKCHKSYNDKYKTAYISQATNSVGYQIRKTSSDSWANYVNSMLKTSDSLYVITSESNALAYWLASPSASDSDGLVGVDSFGSIDIYYCSTHRTKGYGFRPVVCLQSNVTLEKVSDMEYKIVD